MATPDYSSQPRVAWRWGTRRGLPCWPQNEAKRDSHSGKGDKTEFSPLPELESRARTCAGKLAIRLVLRRCRAPRQQRYRVYGLFPLRAPSTEMICYCTPLLLFRLHWFCADHAPRSFSKCFIVSRSISATCYTLSAYKNERRQVNKKSCVF